MFTGGVASDNSITTLFVNLLSYYIWENNHLDFVHFLTTQNADFSVPKLNSFFEKVECAMKKMLEILFCEKVLKNSMYNIGPFFV